MEIRFDKKRALVTGAGKGIGRAIVKALVDCGAEVYALTRTQSDLDTLKQECPGIHPVCVDLTDWDATRKAVQDLGVIDLLVNNAGVAPRNTFLEVTLDDLNSILDVNLKAVFNVSQVVAKGMVERRRGGSIVNISSLSSELAMPMLSAYSASKAGLDQLTRVMALELGPHQIRVNSVRTSLVKTDLSMSVMSDPVAGEVIRKWKERTPLRRYNEMKDVVNPVLYLLSDKSDMINGVALTVDGGLTIC